MIYERYRVHTYKKNGLQENCVAFFIRYCRSLHTALTTVRDTEGCFYMDLAKTETKISLIQEREVGL